MANPAPRKNDAMGVQRGDYGRNLLPALFMATGRLMAGPLQYTLITNHPLTRFGFRSPPTGGSLEILDRTFPRLPFLAAAMPGVLSIKHAVWVLGMSREKMTWSFAFFAVLADTIYESISSTVFTAAGINPFWSERFFYTGLTIFMSSVALEFVSEVQRLSFKSKPENKGKLCTTGFWSITRHINYTANVMFGFGYGLAMGGPLYSILTAGMYLSNFSTNAIPSIEEYTREKYGKAWEHYERDVPYKLIPGIY